MATIKQPQQRYLFLVRHGELAVKNHLAGHTDFLLSENGWRQLHNVTNNLIDIDDCISSPLQRCANFAQDFCQQHNIPLILEPALKEMHFGDFDGRGFTDLWQNSEAATVSIGDFWQDPWSQNIPNGETMANFQQRVQTWWQTWLAQATAGNTLVLTHAGVIKQLLAEILALPMPTVSHINSLEIAYASVIKISIFTDEKGNSWPKIVL